MNRVAASVIAFTAVTIGAVMGAAGGAFAAEKFVIALPNGYEMVRAKSGEPSIVKKRGSVVVPAPIKAFAVVRDVVTGEMLTPESKDAAAAAEPAAAAAPAPAVAAAPPTTPPAAPEGAAGAPAPTTSAPAAAAASSSPAATPAAAAAPSSPAAAPAPGASPAAAPAVASPSAGAPAATGGRRPAAAIDTGSPVFTRPPPNPNARYFVLDTRSGVVSNNLSLQDWEAQLKKLEITTIPELAPPILPK